MPNTPCGAESAAERFRRRPHVSTIAAPVSIAAPRDVVSSEHDQVGLLVHQHADGVRDILVRHPAAVMDVGDEADAQSGQVRRETRGPER